MIDRLEVSSDVEVKNPVVAPASLPSHAQGLLRRFLRPISVGIRMEMRLQNRLQKTRHNHLRNPIRYRGDTQRSRSAVAFGNVDATYRRGKVAARCHAIPELVEIR